MRRWTIALSMLLLAACDKGPTAEEKASQDAVDVARVEAAQSYSPDAQPLSPQRLQPEEMSGDHFSGSGCFFAPDGADGQVIAAAAHETAYLKLDGDLRVFASDKGSPVQPFGMWSRYQGREHVLDFQTSGAENAGRRGERPGRLTIRDAYDRVVYSAAGTLRCHREGGAAVPEGSVAEKSSQVIGTDPAQRR